MDIVEFTELRAFYVRHRDGFLKEVMTDQEGIALFRFFFDEENEVRQRPPSPGEEKATLARIQKEFGKIRAYELDPKSQAEVVYLPREECVDEATLTTYENAFVKLRNRYKLFRNEQGIRGQMYALPLDWSDIVAMQEAFLDSTIRIARASNGQLLSVNGIGQKKLKKIRELIPYNPTAGKKELSRWNAAQRRIMAGQRGLGL